MTKIQYEEANPTHWIKVLGKTPIFLFPARIVGGHELMAVEIIKEITLLGANVTCLVEPSNKKLFTLLSNDDFKSSNIIPLPFCQPQLEFLHAIFNVISIRKAESFIVDVTSKEHSAFLLVQGDIEIGSIYLKAANKRSISYISYLPFTHSAVLMGKKFAAIRKRFSDYLYKITKNYVTISSVFQYELYSLSPGCQVELIRNKIRCLDYFKECRAKYLLTREDVFFNIFIIGRVSYRQKGHDILLDAISRLDKNICADIRLNVVGDGDDFIDFKKCCLTKFPWLNTNFLGWHQEPWLVSYFADLLIIPSRFEGVPLVMLEAQELGIPIVASNRDGMREYLSPDCLFNEENVDSLTIKLTEFIECNSKSRRTT